MTTPALKQLIDFPPPFPSPEEKEQRARERRERADKWRPHIRVRWIEGSGISIGCDTMIPVARDEVDGEAIRAVRQWLSGGQSKWAMLALLGAPGTGKTTAAAYAIAHSCDPLDGDTEMDEHDQRPYIDHRKQTPGHAVTAEELGQVFDPWGRPANEERRQKILRTRMLVIDDLGAEPSQLDVNAALQRVLNHRVDDGRKRTIITSNLTAKELQAVYSARTADRLRQAFPVSLKGKSLRKGAPGWEDAA